MGDSPKITLSYDPAGPLFPISEECEMPSITVTANLVPQPDAPAQYNWTITLIFDGKNCPHAMGRVIKHPDIHQTTDTNTFAIPFSKVRGGNLTVSVSVAVGGAVLKATTQDMQVTGTNPSIETLRKEAPENDAFRKLMRLESGLRQFRSPTCPLFSGDNKGGVGMCQITNPPPTDDQVWSWKENVKAGWQFYLAKQAVARAYPSHVRKSSDFLGLVQTHNAQRKAKGAPALTIEVAEYTEEQLERDTIRGYNGYAGGLHEHRVRVDVNGLLIVTENGSTGVAVWETLSAAERTVHYDKLGVAPNNRGDVNYVEDVMKESGF